MSSFGQGIKVTYAIDREYFKYGEAYRLKLGTNKYVHAICINIEDDSVTFAYYSNQVGQHIELKLTLDELMYSNSYDIVKLTADYKDGKFGE